MPRTTLAVQTAPDVYADDGLVLTFTAADVANGNQFVSNGREVIFVLNADAASRNFTRVSAPDDMGRTEDTVDAIAAGATRMYVMAMQGWRQSTGHVYINGDHAALLIAIVRMPG